MADKVTKEQILNAIEKGTIGEVFEGATFEKIDDDHGFIHFPNTSKIKYDIRSLKGKI